MADPSSQARRPPAHPPGPLPRWDGAAEPSAGNGGIVDCALYQDGRRRDDSMPLEETIRIARSRTDTFVWIGLYEPTAEEFAGIAAAFDLHPLAVEDAVHAHQRPKIEMYDDTLFMILKPARYLTHGNFTATSQAVETGELAIFIGSNFVVTVRHGIAGALGDVRRNLEDRPELLRLGPGAVLYAVADRVVDEYVRVTESLQDDVDEVEAGVFAPRSADSQRIYQLKRELLEFKRAVVPLRRPLRELADGKLPHVPHGALHYFRDVQDHVERVAEQVGAFDELLNGILSASLAQIGVTQNNDMRKISAWVAIAAVPTLLAGIYGMNFANMPELHWAFGYGYMLGVSATICSLLYLAFRRSGWL